MSTKLSLLVYDLMRVIEKCVNADEVCYICKVYGHLFPTCPLRWIKRDKSQNTCYSCQVSECPKKKKRKKRRKWRGIQKKVLMRKNLWQWRDGNGKKNGIFESICWPISSNRNWKESISVSLGLDFYNKNGVYCFCIVTARIYALSPLPISLDHVLVGSEMKGMFYFTYALQTWKWDKICQSLHYCCILIFIKTLDTYSHTHTMTHRTIVCFFFPLTKSLSLKKKTYFLPSYVLCLCALVRLSVCVCMRVH